MDVPPPSKETDENALGRAIDAIIRNHQSELASQKALYESQLRIVDRAHAMKVSSARLEIALALKAVLAAKIALGKSTPEEKIIVAITELISQKDGDVTGEELLAKIEGLLSDKDK